MRYRRSSWLAGAIVALGSVAFAQSQDVGFNANNFKPTLDGFGYITTEGARALRPFQLHGKAVFNWVNNPLQFRGTTRKVIDDASTIDLVFGIGLIEFGNGGLQLGVDLPYIADQEGQRFNTALDKLEDADIGDIRLQLKAVLMDREDDAIGLFARGWIEFPSGEVNDFMSNRDSVPTLNMSVGAEKQMGPLRMAVELGWEWIDGDIRIGGVHIDDKAHVKAGIALAPFESMRDLEIMVDLNHWFRISNPYNQEVEAPIELGGAIKYSGTIDLMVGGSGGLNKGVGAPDARFFASAGITF